MWFDYAQRRVHAQSLGGLGPPGGFRPQGFSLSTKYGGPRWWPFSQDRNLYNFIEKQTRYNPEYIPIGEAAMPKDDGWETIAHSKDPFFGKDPADIKILPVEDGDNKEKAVLLLIDEANGEARVEQLPLEAQDMVKELKNWKFNIVPDENGEYDIMGAKINQDGDEKGIFELNKEPSTPGWKYWMKQTPSPSPSDQSHGDLSSFEWSNWRSNGGQVGM